MERGAPPPLYAGSLPAMIPPPSTLRSNPGSIPQQAKERVGTRACALMKVVVNELDGCKRGLEVEVPSEQVVQEVERSFKEYSRHARVPGFRQGKIPIDIVRRRFGKEVRDEVIGRMVREFSLKALEEKKL